MRMLTLHQPWASLVALGAKTIETRAWSTAYRGPLAIHAGASIPSYLGLGRSGTVTVGEYSFEKDGPGQALLRGGLGWPYRLPFGAVVAVCDLVDCLPMTTHADIGDMECLVVHGDGTLDHAIPGADWAHLIRDIADQEPYGHFEPGRFGWVLGNVRAVRPPVPCRGHQGLRSCETDVARILAHRLAA